MKVKYFICDAPARSLLKGIISHNGYNCCERCIAKGLWMDHRMVMNELEAELRTDEEFLNFSYDGTHQKSRSILADLGINCVSGFPLDYMNLVCLGVTRRMLYFLKSGPRVCSFSETIVRIIRSSGQALWVPSK